MTPRSRRRPTALVAAAVVAAAALIAACGDGPPSPGTTSPGRAGSANPAASGQSTPAITSAGAYRPLPLDAYRFSDEQMHVYYQAVQLLRTRCLAEYGFTPYPDPPAPPKDPDNGAYVTEHGYGSVVTPQDRAYEEAMREYQAEFDKHPPSAAYLLVDTGAQPRDGIDPPSDGSSKTVVGKDVYPTGCTGWAQDQISTKDRSSGQPRELRPIYDAAWAAYAADPALAALQAEWSCCMAEQGYTFATPDEAPYGPPPTLEPDASGKVKVSPPEELPVQVEQAIARADLACRARTSYEDSNHELLAKHQRALIEKNATELGELQQNLAEELRAAAAIVSGTSPSPRPASP